MAKLLGMSRRGAGAAPELSSADRMRQLEKRKARSGYRLATTRQDSRSSGKPHRAAGRPCFPRNGAQIEAPGARDDSLGYPCRRSEKKRWYTRKLAAVRSLREPSVGRVM